MFYWSLPSLFLLGAMAMNSFEFDGSDLIEYRTLPGNRVTKWNITYHDRSQVAPGYWFISPYWSLADHEETKGYFPLQVGPYIFDQDGVLVWAGAIAYHNRQAHDFRVINFDPHGKSDLQPHLSWQLRPGHHNPESKGRAVIYNNQYRVAKEVSIPRDEANFHEFNVKNSPKAMMSRTYHVRVDLEKLGLQELGEHGEKKRVRMGGFVEMDLHTGEQTFQWSGEGKVALDESFIVTAGHPEQRDVMHLNSVDKNENGDFLISSRHTYAVYLVSGQDGNILWRLGGKKNDFDMDFVFSGQHDARFISGNSTSMVISLLNNGALHAPFKIVNEPISSAMYIELDLVAMKATLLKSYMRPDGGSTDRRGNVQTLPNGNTFICWGASGYIGEHSPDGKLLMEAKFASDRFDTYRAYKFPWVGRPSYPPTLLAEAYNINGSDLSTLFHVSWNGATEVEYWRFYGRDNSTSNRTEMGTVQKRGFETSFMAPGFMAWVSVAALDSHFEVLGISPESLTPPPGSEPVSVPVSALHFTDNEGPAKGKMQVGAFIRAFIAGLTVSGAVCAAVKWYKVLVGYVLSGYAWVLPTGHSSYSRVSQGKPGNPEDEEAGIAILDQEGLESGRSSLGPG